MCKSRSGRFARRWGEGETKTLIASEQQRADVARLRAAWKKSQPSIDPQCVVFIDETWAKTNMTRTYGRSEQGTRVVQHVPHGRWETTTFVGALRATRFVAPLTADGPINGRLFLAWVEQHLAPTLSPGDIVIMDNLSNHKVTGVREAIEATGAVNDLIARTSNAVAQYWWTPEDYLRILLGVHDEQGINSDKEAWSAELYRRVQTGCGQLGGGARLLVQARGRGRWSESEKLA